MLEQLISIKRHKGTFAYDNFIQYLS